MKDGGAKTEEGLGGEPSADWKQTFGFHIGNKLTSFIQASLEEYLALP